MKRKTPSNCENFIQTVDTGIKKESQKHKSSRKGILNQGSQGQEGRAGKGNEEA